jgi:tetratricopeptide (TPR) repeat protein
LKLDFLSVREDDLKDTEVWEPFASSATLDSLRAHAERVAAEDEEAERLLEPFYKSPAMAAMTNMHTLGKRYMTGGIVRRLNARANAVCESEPLDALTFADLAVTVSETLPDDTYPAKGIYELRGTAWKERARALHLLGRLNEALESLDRAERAYRRVPSATFGLANVAHVRAAVLYEQQRLHEAATLAEEAERAFAHLGDDDRRMRALYLRACIRYEAQDLGSAIALFREVVRYGDDVDNPTWIARGSYAVGNCEVDRMNLGEASMHFHKALAIFREMGPPVDRVNTEWGIARVLLQAGKHAEAVRRLRVVSGEFEKRGMVTDMALVGLDIADGLLALGHPEEIVDLANRLFVVFTDAGMLTGALTAIAYVKEAAATGKLTSAALRVVRTFLKRAERQPELVFIPPPDSPR